MTLPRQQLLDLKLEQTPSLENFVEGRNDELLGRLRMLASPDCLDAVYLWGPSGCGRTHLLQAVADLARARRPCRYLPAAQLGGQPEGTLEPGSGGLLIIDDVERLSAEGQSVLFKTFNAARLVGLSLLIAGSAPPRELALREDLRTRVGQMLIFEIKPLSDEEKSDALRRHALLRGMRMDEGLLQYLLRHGRRDLPTLMSILDALDQTTLEQQRPATLPLLREVMQLDLPAAPDKQN